MMCEEMTTAWDAEYKALNSTDHPLIESHMGASMKVIAMSLDAINHTLIDIHETMKEKDY